MPPSHHFLAHVFTYEQKRLENLFLLSNLSLSQSHPLSLAVAVSLAVYLSILFTFSTLTFAQPMILQQPPILPITPANPAPVVVAAKSEVVEPKPVPSKVPELVDKSEQYLK